MIKRKLQSTSPSLFLLAALCIFGTQSATVAQNPNSNVSTDALRQVELGKIMQSDVKPLTTDEKLKIVNENLLKANLPPLKNLSSGASVKLSVENMKNSQAALDFWHGTVLGQDGVAFFYPNTNGSLNIRLKPSIAAGRQFFDCSIGIQAVNPTAKFSITTGQGASLSEVAEITISGSKMQRLSFVIDFPKAGNNQVKISTNDNTWAFKNCEITPLK